MKILLALLILGIFCQCMSDKVQNAQPPQEVKCPNPNHEKSTKLYMSGWDELLNHNYEVAINYFKKSIELDSNCNGVFQQYRELTKALFAIGDNENAYKYVKIAIPKTTNLSVKSDFLVVLAAKDYFEENYAVCIKTCTDALSYDLKNVDAHFYRGVSKFILNDKVGSYNDLTNIITQYEAIYAVDPNSDELEQKLQSLEKMKFKNIAYTYFFRGLILHSFGKKEEGCIDLRKAGENGYAKAYKYISDYCN